MALLGIPHLCGTDILESVDETTVNGHRLLIFKGIKGFSPLRPSLLGKIVSVDNERHAIIGIERIGLLDITGHDFGLLVSPMPYVANEVSDPGQS